MFCPLMVAPAENGPLGSGPTTSVSASSRVRFNSVTSLSWSFVKPFPGWKFTSNRQTNASSVRLSPPTIDFRLDSTISESLPFRSLSINTAADNGLFPRLFPICTPNSLFTGLHALTSTGLDASESPPGRIPLYEFFLARTGAAGKSFTRKVYMPFFYRIVAVTATCALALGCFATALNRLAAQEPAQSGGSISSQVSLVNLFATVRDKNKRVVTDLTQNDFQIFMDNDQQKIAFFNKEVTLPVTLGLLIDTSGSEQY